MKILSTIGLSIVTTSSLYAQTTMCFKEEHSSMNTIENTKLDGGECLSQYSLKEMKDKGWKVNDIKISQSSTGKLNFVYILKKGEQIDFAMAAAGISQEEMEDRILEKIEKRKEKEKKEAEIKRTKQSIAEGKNFYSKNCASCHGNKGEIEAMNTSRKLNSMSEKEISNSISSYLNDNKFDKGRAYVMKPYAALVDYKDIKNISAYLESINPKAK